MSRITENAILAAKEAAAGKIDISIAERIYAAARLHGADRSELAPARRYLASARRAEMVLA